MSDSPRPLTEEERQAIRADVECGLVIASDVLRLLDLLKQAEQERAQAIELRGRFAAALIEKRARLEQSEARAANLEEQLLAPIPVTVEDLGVESGTEEQSERDA